MMLPLLLYASFSIYLTPTQTCYEYKYHVTSLISGNISYVPSTWKYDYCIEKMHDLCKLIQQVSALQDKGV